MAQIALHDQICPDFLTPTKPLPRRQAPLRWPLAQVEGTIQAALRAMNGQGTPAGGGCLGTFFFWGKNWCPSELRSFFSPPPDFKHFFVNKCWVWLHLC